MEFSHKMMTALFEDAKILLTEPFACCRLMTASMHLTLPPRSLGNAKKGILEQLSAGLRLYNERLDGILIAFNHVGIQQSYGTIMTSQPDVHFDVVAEFVIFQPTPGSVIKATVTKTERSTVGDEVLIEIQKIYTTRDGLISMRGKLANPSLLSSMRGQKRSFSRVDSFDSGVESHSFATPSMPPRKKSRCDSSFSDGTPLPAASSTPYPSHDLSQDTVSGDDSGSLESSSKKKKKKSKKRKDYASDETLNVSSFDLSLNNSRKKKKKDKDRDKQNYSADISKEVLNVSLVENGHNVSAQAFSKDTKKERKERRRSEKSQANLNSSSGLSVSLEMSDSGSSNATIDAMMTPITAKSSERKKKKKEKK